MKKQIVLFFMTKKGLDVLSSLINYKMHEYVALVVIGKDNKQYDYSNEIKDLCIENKINWVFRVPDLIIDDLIEYNYAIAIGWRWMISGIKKLIVLHDSLLPKYRGFAPLVNGLINREKFIGATALWASEKFDSGDIIIQKKKEISYPIKIEAAIGFMSSLYQSILKELFLMITNNELLPKIPQDDTKATYSIWRDENDYGIDWRNSSNEILTKINAVGFPYKGAFSILEGRKVRILSANEIDDLVIENRDCGKVIFNIGEFPVIICGVGLLQITEVVYDDTQHSVLPLKIFRIRLE